MKLNQFAFYLVAIFAIFLGSQITEGVILVPYWQSLPAKEFYSFYQQFGPPIGQFYTVLTIIAALIPLSVTLFLFLKKSPAFKYALASTIFALLFVASFYSYFKGANELFYQATLNEELLAMELIRWEKWHWSRIVIELLSLICLILAFSSHEKFSRNEA